MLTLSGVINCIEAEGGSNRLLLLLLFGVTLSEPADRRTLCPVQTPATRGTTRAVRTCSVTTGTIHAAPHRFTLPNSKSNLKQQQKF